MYKVFDHESFYPKLELDLKDSRFLVVIQSPFMTTRRINNLRPILANCIARGVRVCVFAQKIDEQYSKAEGFEQRIDALEFASQRLLSIGVHVNLVKGIHEKLISVDENVLWEGSLNALSHRNTSERMTRWQSRNEVHSAVSKHKLDKCIECRQLSFEGDIKNVVGSLIYRRRLQLNLTQSDLSKMTKISQSTLSKIELGKFDCRLTTTSKLLKVLSLDCRLNPRFMTPVIDGLLNYSLTE